MERHLAVCPLSELGPGEMRRVDRADGPPILVCNIGGTVWAVDDTCTHSEASLSRGELEGDEVFCPVHWGCFHVPTGRATGFPAERDLRTWPVEVQRDGVQGDGVQGDMVVIDLGER